MRIRSKVKLTIKRYAPTFALHPLLRLRDEFKSKVTHMPVAPPGTDWVGYEAIIKFIDENNILSIEGDLVEIGTFLGGIYKLSQFLKKRKSAKKLYVIDIFDPKFDSTSNIDGNMMSTLYENALKSFGGKTQWDIFSSVTRSCDNIFVLKGNSREVKIPATKICFGFIDGNHSPEYVVNDFRILWDKLSANGCIAFHDYGGDLPETTATINELIGVHSNKIKKIHNDKSKWILFIIKNRN